jgi:hypothetical protein
MAAYAPRPFWGLLMLMTPVSHGAAVLPEQPPTAAAARFRDKA